MYHTIEFRVPARARIEMLGKDHLTQISIKKGARMQAQIRPYVVETSLGPIEVADLLLADGSAARAVRFASFKFIDE